MDVTPFVHIHFKWLSNFNRDHALSNRAYSIHQLLSNWSLLDCPLYQDCLVWLRLKVKITSIWRSLENRKNSSKFLIFRKSHVLENGEITRNSRFLAVPILSKLAYQNCPSIFWIPWTQLVDLNKNCHKNSSKMTEIKHNCVKNSFTLSVFHVQK